MLISVHLPKTGGTSFRTSLTDHFGDKLMRVHDRPINTPPFKRNLYAASQCAVSLTRNLGTIECIHGHFQPLRYLSLKFRRGTRFITWLRDPAQRLVSHYRFFELMQGPDARSLLLKKMVAERWSLEDYCLCPELRNFYSQFLWGFPLACFDFIGIVEHFEEDLRFFSESFLGLPLPVYRENVNEQSQGRLYDIPTGLQEKIERFHASDYAIYRRVLACRQARRGG